MLANETIHDWYLTYNAFDKTPGKWNLTMLAEDICKFDDILQTCTKQAVMTVEGLLKAISDFQAYTIGVNEAASVPKM